MSNIVLFKMLWGKCSRAERAEIRALIERTGETSEQRRKLDDDAKRILDFLNQETGKNFRAVPANINLIRARLKEGASVSDCKAVIIRRVKAWGSKPDMQEYLRPATLFNQSKFEQYIGELK